jgi:hypothetical protein
LSTDLNNKKSLFGFAIIITLIVVVAGIYGSYNGEENRNEVNSKTTDKVDIQKQRHDGVYELSRNFNDFIVREDKMYGYDLFSEQAKRNTRMDTYEKYVVWAKRMKESFPLLGTAETKIEYGNRDAIDLRIGEFDDGIHFILEVDESDKVYTINEIRSYSTVDKPERLYDGSGCYLIAQEKSQDNEDCPLW